MMIKHRIKPILFSGPMVRAILDGRKTQTRRVLKPPPTRIDGLNLWYRMPCGGLSLNCHKRPYTIRDLIWVRETFSYDILDIDHDGTLPVWYWADGKPKKDIYRTGRRPSIFMPRWASRITLEVTSVRVERVQSISEDDAIAEGIYRVDPTVEEIKEGFITADDFVFMAPGTRQGWGDSAVERNREQWGPTASFAFKCLWDSLNAKRGFGWETNPWVIAITFKPHFEHVDTVAARMDAGQ